MAQLGNTHSIDGATDAAGVREDLSNLIGLIDPDEVPFQTMIAGKNKATNDSHDWQTQALATANRANASVQGDDLGSSYAAVTPSVRINNRTQIFVKSFVISETLRAADTAGREDEVDYQKLLKGMEIRRDKEAAYVSNTVLVVPAAATAGRLRGFGAFIAGNAADDSTAANSTHGTSGVTPAVTTLNQTTALTAGTNRTLTLAMVSAAIRRSFVNGGNSKYILCTPAHKALISSLMGGTTAGMANARFNMTNKREQAAIIAGADVFTSDFGALTIVPDRFCLGAVSGDAESELYVIDPRYVKTTTFRPYKAEEMAKTGDASKWMCVEECTLEVLAPGAHAKVSDLTN